MGVEYWTTCVEEAFDELGLFGLIPADKWPAIAKAMQSIAEMESEACGYHCIPNPIQSELETTKRALRDEREKVICRECNGVGRLTFNGPYHSANTQCHKCNGEGRHKP